MIGGEFEGGGARVSALHVATLLGSVGDVEALLDNGATVDLRMGPGNLDSLPR